MSSAGGLLRRLSIRSKKGEKKVRFGGNTFIEPGEAMKSPKNTYSDGAVDLDVDADGYGRGDEDKEVRVSSSGSVVRTILKSPKPSKSSEIGGALKVRLPPSH